MILCIGYYVLVINCTNGGMEEHEYVRDSVYTGHSHIIRPMYNVIIHNIKNIPQRILIVHVSTSIYNSCWSLQFDGHNMEDKTVILEVLAVVGHTQAKFRVGEELVPATSIRSLSTSYLSRSSIF